MRGKALFITGTSTAVGKTVVTGLICRMMKEKGMDIAPQKWIQTGSNSSGEDILIHLRAMGSHLADYRDSWDDMNPYILNYPASPHLAARIDKTAIDKDKIKLSTERLMSVYEYVLIEGSGGLMVPIDERTLMADIVVDIGIPVLIIAANRLGAINHTLLTIEALKKRGLMVLGVIFNEPDLSGDSVVLEDNPDIVSRFSGVPVLGALQFIDDMGRLYESFRPIGESLLKRVREADG